MLKTEKPVNSLARLKNVFRMITNMWHTYKIYVKYMPFPVQNLRVKRNTKQETEIVLTLDFHANI